MGYIIRLSIVLLVSLLLFPPLYGQTNSTFEKGEILLDNSQVITGLIWIVDNPGGLKKVYYKPGVTEMVSEYSAFDLVSISLQSGNRLIVSEAIPTPDGPERKLAEVHFKGNLTLISCTESAHKTYYIIDNEGNVSEMENSYSIPGQAGNYNLTFNNEYIDVLKRHLIDESKYEKQLESTYYNDKSLSKLLKKYHSVNKYDYKVYPPPLFTGFIGAGASLLFMEHQSDVNPDFISTSPFTGLSFIAGLKTAAELIEISYEAALSYGIIYHDNYSEEFDNLISYYEDIARTTIFTNNFNIGINPLNTGKIRPHVGFGIFYNIYTGYSRELTEELFYEDAGLVLNNFYDDFEKPGPFFGAFARVGITYDQGGSNSARLAYTYNKYLGEDPGPKQLHAITISFIHNIF